MQRLRLWRCDLSSMNVDAGALNKRIEIVKLVQIKDSAGYYSTAEEVVRKCWAQFTRQSGKEYFRAGADFSIVVARFLVRASSVPLNRLMYVKYNGDYYSITYVNEYGDSGQYTEIIAELKQLGGSDDGHG